MIHRYSSLIPKDVLQRALKETVEISNDSPYFLWASSMLPTRCFLVRVEIKPLDAFYEGSNILGHTSVYTVSTPNGEFYCEGFITKPPYKSVSPRRLRRVCKNFMKQNKHRSWEGDTNTIPYFPR